MPIEKHYLDNLNPGIYAIIWIKGEHKYIFKLPASTLISL